MIGPGELGYVWLSVQSTAFADVWLEELGVADFKVRLSGMSAKNHIEIGISFHTLRDAWM